MNTVRHIFTHNMASTTVVDIPTLGIIEGYLPPRVLGLVIEWAILNKEKLLNNWQNIEQKKPLLKIEPLQ